MTAIFDRHTAIAKTECRAAAALGKQDCEGGSRRRDERQLVPIPVREIKRLVDLAAQRDEFRAADEANLAVVETWLAGFPQETP